ncbi:MAG: hypothetical protein PVI71_05880, partial [Desulfobacterales bacterium]
PNNKLRCEVFLPFYPVYNGNKATPTCRHKKPVGIRLRFHGAPIISIGKFEIELELDVPLGWPSKTYWISGLFLEADC